MYLPAELERLRIEQNLSLRELSRRARLGLPTVRNVMAGGGNVTSVIKTANALGYSIKWTFDDYGVRRVAMLGGSLATQLRVWRKRFTERKCESFATSNLSGITIRSIESGAPCRFEKLERYARLLGLEPTLVRGDLLNSVDLGTTEGNWNAAATQQT